MGISLPTDIVLDVARAADPVKYQAASRRLSEVSEARDGMDFSKVLNGMNRRVAGGTPTDPHTLATTFRNETALVAGTKEEKAAQQLEAFILQNFIDSMLPKDADNVFGKGTAGGIWKSMLAEQISNQIAKTGGIGIAKQVLAAQAFINARAQDDTKTSSNALPSPKMHSRDERS